MITTKLVWNGDREKTQMNQAIVKALLRSVNIVRADAILRVPVDTGTLRSSIKSGLDKGKLEGRVDTNVEYAPSVEFGTRYQRPQPFLKPALFDNRDTISKIFIDEGSKSVDK